MPAHVLWDTVCVCSRSSFHTWVCAIVCDVWEWVRIWQEERMRDGEREQANLGLFGLVKYGHLCERAFQCVWLAWNRDSEPGATLHEKTRLIPNIYPCWERRFPGPFIPAGILFFFFSFFLSSSISWTLSPPHFQHLFFILYLFIVYFITNVTKVNVKECSQVMSCQ